MGLPRGACLVMLIALVKGCTSTNGRRERPERQSLTSAALGILKRATSEYDVLQVLRMAGYKQANVSKREYPPSNVQASQSRKDVPFRTVGHTCHNRSIDAVTRYANEGAAITLAAKGAYNLKRSSESTQHFWSNKKYLRQQQPEHEHATPKARRNCRQR